MRCCSMTLVLKEILYCLVSIMKKRFTEVSSVWTISTVRIIHAKTPSYKNWCNAQKLGWKKMWKQKWQSRKILRFISFESYKLVNCNIFVVISWLPPLISQYFSLRLLRAKPVFSAWLFLHGVHFFLYGIKGLNSSL